MGRKSAEAVYASTNLRWDADEDGPPVVRSVAGAGFVPNCELKAR